MTERQIERWLGQQVRDLGGLYFKWVSPGNVGVPDRIIILPGGHIVLAEIKTDFGQMTPQQDRLQRRLAAIGADVQLVIGLAGAEALVKRIRSRLGGGA